MLLARRGRNGKRVFLKPDFRRRPSTFARILLFLPILADLALLAIPVKSAQNCSNPLAEQRNSHSVSHTALNQGVLAGFGQNWSKLLKMVTFWPLFGHFWSLFRDPRKNTDFGHFGQNPHLWPSHWISGVPEMVPKWPLFGHFWAPRTGPGQPQNPGFWPEKCQNRSFFVFFLTFLGFSKKPAKRLGIWCFWDPFLDPFLRTLKKAPAEQTEFWTPLEKPDFPQNPEKHHNKRVFIEGIWA